VPARLEGPVRSKNEGCDHMTCKKPGAVVITFVGAASLPTTALTAFVRWVILLTNPRACTTCKQVPLYYAFDKNPSTCKA